MTATSVKNAIPADDFRHLIGRFTTGVTVVTTSDGGVPYGTTASALTSVSLDPPTLLICMNHQSETGQAIARSGHFAVNVLGEDQGAVARAFARKGSDFGGHSTNAGGRGSPIFVDALARFECRVVDAMDAATHTVLIGVVEAASGRDGMPLTYFCGRFGRFAHADVRDSDPT
jgi:flavin reductase (DIM6/NTAB) family NADH-FMN oxidoreductase RutF